MSEREQFSELVERIYDAALEATLWPSVLEKTCAYVHGCTANIFCQNASDSVTLYYSWGDDPTYRRSYMESYAAMNPLFPASAYLELGVVHALDEIMPIREFKETRLYREWIKPQGILDLMHCNLERTGNGSAAIAIRRREVDGLFDEAQNPDSGWSYRTCAVPWQSVTSSTFTAMRLRIWRLRLMV